MTIYLSLLLFSTLVGTYMSNGPMISFGNFGTGKFLYEWRSHEYRNLKFSMNHERYIANPPMNGLAGVVKNNFSKSGEAASGEIVFYHNC